MQKLSSHFVKEMRYFISGHTDITAEQWDANYKKRIERACADGAEFVVGDSFGVDRLALQQLWIAHYDPSKVTIYHIGTEHRFHVKGYFRECGGFSSHTMKDSAMTFQSDEDILWIRPKEETIRLLGSNYNPKYVSGTERNALRRLSFTKD